MSQILINSLPGHGCEPAAIERVAANILATKHDQVPNRHDEQLVVDVDLSILGRSSDAYDRFEENIRREYRWVPWFLYRRKRAEILQSFVSRPRIYSTDWFANEFELQARRNLERAITELMR